MTRKLPLALAAASLAAAPVAAQATTVPVDRSSQPAAEDSELRGGMGPALIIVALAAVGMLVLLLTEDDEDEAFSP